MATPYLKLKTYIFGKGQHAMIDVSGHFGKDLAYSARNSLRLETSFYNIQVKKIMYEEAQRRRNNNKMYSIKITERVGDSFSTDTSQLRNHSETNLCRWVKQQWSVTTKR